MFKVTGDTIEITRGDKAVLSLTVDGYNFVVGDTVEFRVYKKNGLNQSPVLSKTITVDTAGESIDITLSTSDTTIGSAISKPVEYWYEIELNDDTTVIGYDENGAKIFKLYPEGVES